MEAAYLVYSSYIAALGEKLGSDTADAFHQRLLQAASQSGGRLLVVDADGKVTYDTFGERCGTLLALGEVRSVLRGEKDADYGFHLRDGAGKTQAPSVLDALTGRDISRVWVGCFVSPLEADGQRTGALLLLTDVQETVDSLISVRDRMAFIFLLALTAVLVGRLAQLESFGVPYLAPFAPGQGKDGYGVLRWPTHRVKFREAILHTRNRRRQG